MKLIRMDTVQEESVEWLLYPFIPYGKITILQGDPGEGKIPCPRENRHLAILRAFVFSR